jgi:hypothetical protein
MSTGRQEILKESRIRGVTAGAAVAGTVVLGVVAAPVAIVVAAAVPTALLGYRWWSHRAKNGIRF